MEDVKKLCAKAALNYIQDGMVIGLGGGSTISYLVEYINGSNKKVTVVTPSVKTFEKCMEYGLKVLITCNVDHIDVAFDGCDQVDENLNALKSGGAIHTKEKIIASMADEYILLVDKSKVVQKLNFMYPVVLEIVNDSKSYVERKLTELGAVVNMRSSSAKDGYTISDYGNPIMEAHFSNVEDIKKLNKELNKICGVIDTSLFYNIATTAIIADENKITIMERAKRNEEI